MKWLILCFVCIITACASPSVTTPNTINYAPHLPSSAATAYLNGKILILYGYNESTAVTEAFGDWQAYLDDYISSTSETVYRQKISADMLVKLTTTASMASEFTLFLKMNSPTYYYSDFIVEPQVYTAVEAAYSGKRLNEENRAFLPEQLN